MLEITDSLKADVKLMLKEAEKVGFYGPFSLGIDGNWFHVGERGELTPYDDDEPIPLRYAGEDDDLGGTKPSNPDGGLDE